MDGKIKKPNIGISTIGDRYKTPRLIFKALALKLKNVINQAVQIIEIADKFLIFILYLINSIQAVTCLKS